MKLQNLLELLLVEDIEEQLVTLYHGTSAESAEALLSYGWAPNSGFRGGNFGQTKYLYLTNSPKNAQWFANEKGEDSILQVLVPLAFLIVDPEDGIEDTVPEELNHKPGSVALTKALGPKSFSVYGEKL